MGCGSSTANTSAVENRDGQNQLRTTPVVPNGGGPATPPMQQSSPAEVTPGGECHEGKERYLACPSMRWFEQGEKVYYVALYVSDHVTLSGLTVVCRDAAGTVWSKSLTDDEVRDWKDRARPRDPPQKPQEPINLKWPTFWRSLAAGFSKSPEPPRAVAGMGGKKHLDVFLKTKDSRLFLPIELPCIGSDPRLTHEYFVQPFFNVDRRLEWRNEGGKAAPPAAPQNGAQTQTPKHGGQMFPPPPQQQVQTEARLNAVESALQRDLTKIEDSTIVVGHRRDDARRVNQEHQDTSERLNNLEKQVRKLKKVVDQELEPHHLDGLYNVGGARFFDHTRWAMEHQPQNITYSDDLLTLLKARFQNTENHSLRHLNAATDPVVKKVLESAPNLEHIHEVIRLIDQVDEYDFDPFALDERTNGGALLYTAWALMHKYDLLSHFNIDEKVLLNFWVAITAGYHANPYHNATHAADVLQCMHYIIGPGQMSVTVRMKKEDILSSLIAAGIHDYDHPGFNNSFHTRTSAYLATLYNDRSVLENHHAACSFEIMRRDEYNIMASLSDEQKKEVREEVLELLLSTDMGIHAKIFTQFRRMLAESPDWSTEKKKDIKLIMVMAIKMADISNCSRRRDLYLRWADRIADEFYRQGDNEDMLGIPISPFMNRKNKTTEFAKGQISFMNYIVLPMFEDVAQLLPQLRPLVNHIEDNRAHWSIHQKQMEAREASLKEAERDLI